MRRGAVIAAAVVYTDDGSLASVTEAWIVQQLKTLPIFANGTVERYPGSGQPDGQKIMVEMLAKRQPYAAVLFESDVPVALEEGQQSYEPTYGIYVAQKIDRPALSRIGDANRAGTNLMRDLMRNALHDQRPGCEANGYIVDFTEFRGVRIVFQRNDAFIMRAEMVTRESPLA